MAKFYKTIAGCLLAVFLVAGVAAPTLASGKSGLKIPLISIMCQGNPGSCPCPGC